MKIKQDKEISKSPSPVIGTKEVSSLSRVRVRGFVGPVSLQLGFLPLPAPEEFQKWV